MPHNRWRPKSIRELLWVVSIIVALAFAFIVVCSYLFGWKWTGLPNETLWDWLDLLIVPVVLALGGYLFTRSENRRTQEDTDRQRDLDRETADQRTREDRKIAQERAETDRHIADQRRQDDALQAYLDQMNSLLLEHNLRTSGTNSDTRTLARARTLTVLASMAPSRKTRIMQFLVEANLVQGGDEVDPIIRLSGVDLTGADLSHADLSYADLSCNLQVTQLGTFESCADLSGANLIGTNLIGTNLKGADLSNTNLSLALVRAEQLDQARSLEGATMPDGQTLKSDANPDEPTYEDWFKSKDSGEDEKNGGSP